MLTYSFENTGSAPMYEHLARCIKNDVISGNLRPGEKLPSKRAFAENLGISVITVEGAYGLLIDEGLIYSIPKKGFYVADLNGLSSGKTACINPGNTISSGGDNAFIADFAGNETDTCIFPFSIWAKTMRGVMRDKRSELMVNPPCGGIMELRQAIARHLLGFRGMNICPEQVVIGAGTEYLYSLLIQILGRDNIFGIENPGYHKSAKIYGQNDIHYEYIRMDAYGVIPSVLDEKK